MTKDDFVDNIKIVEGDKHVPKTDDSVDTYKVKRPYAAPGWTRSALATSIAKRKKSPLKQDFEPMTIHIDDEDMNALLNIKQVVVTSKHSPWIQMFGCHRCFKRGTSLCPHGLKGKERHANLICAPHLRECLFKLKVMSNASGMRFYRNQNIINMQELLDHYLAKLNDLKQQDELSSDEKELLPQLIKMQENLGKRIDKGIELLDKSTSKDEIKLTPDQLNRLLNSNREKSIDAEVIE